MKLNAFSYVYLPLSYFSSNCLFVSLSHFSTGLFVFFQFIYKSSLHSLDTNHLSDMCIVNIFSVCQLSVHFLDVFSFCR